MGYLKLHDQLFTSSIIEADITVRWVWVGMLLSCDKNGNVHGTGQALSRKFNVMLVQFNKALNILMAPDENSTSQEHGGRRIIEVGPNFYHCVNYTYYRGLKDPAEEREKTRERVAKHRAKKALESGNTDVTKCNDIAEAESIGIGIGIGIDTSHDHPVDDRKSAIPFDDFWTPLPKKVGKLPCEKKWYKLTIKNQKAAMEALPRNIEEWAKREAKYIPHPHTWLCREGWLDELEAAPAETNSLWMYDTYTRFDFDYHNKDPRWEEYKKDAATYPPCKAPPFDEWLSNNDDKF